MVKWIATLVLCILLAAPAPAQQASAASQEEIVERILELQRRIEALMAALPPARRAELRQRLAESDFAKPAKPAPAVPAPAPVPAPVPAETVEASPLTRAPVEPAAPVIAEAKPGAVETPAPTVPAAVPPAAVPPAAAPAPVSDGIPKLIRRRSRRLPCNTLRQLDENSDGMISSADRYWRYLYLWTDKNGDRQMQDREVESAYDRRVREITVSLDAFNRTKGGLGEIRIEDRIVLDLRGDGFSERARHDDGVLVIDASALRRGNGPRLLDASGEALEGFQPLRSGLRLELAGEVTALNCPP